MQNLQVRLINNAKLSSLLANNPKLDYRKRKIASKIPAPGSCVDGKRPIVSLAPVQKNLNLRTSTPVSSQAATSQPSASGLSLTSVSSENSDLVALNGAIDMVESEIVLNESGDSDIMAVPIYRLQTAGSYHPI